MSRFLVLLRAVNVAGKNRIPMAEFRAAVSDLGYSNIATYVQSGNLVLSSNEPGSKIVANIHRSVAETFGHDVTVILRSANELSTTIANYPYAKSLSNQAGVVFLDQEVKLKESTARFAPDRFVSAGSDVYVDCPSGFGKTKLTINWIERQGDCRGTRRNWKTVLKLAELLQQD